LKLAPWPVDWLDPAPAIARRVADLLGPRPMPERPTPPRMIFTSGRLPSPILASALVKFGF
jgi:glutamate racemase